ncbi:MAG: J domain-containing protein [Novosphingobium sp.]|nr:J domain-containing protein [Novosphingobium sp.]
MDKKDYYEILGVDKNATEKEIKAAFRKISIEHHPDKHPTASEEEKNEHEELFKQAAEAYEVLSDKEKRQHYDMYGHNSNSQNFEDISDFFKRRNPFFNDFDNFGSRKNKIKKGNDIRHRLELTLEELYNGVNKKFEVNTQLRCDSCSGSGLGENGEKIPCPVCGGNGFITHARQMGYQTIIQQQPCTNCNQSGTVIKNPCSKCGGLGLMEGTKTIEVEIKPGLSEGMVLKMRGNGAECSDINCENGDLHIHIIELPHSSYKRDENDLMYIKEINIIDLMLGSNVEVEIIDKTKVKFKVSELTEDGKTFRLSGKGMSIFNSSKRGDLLVVLKAKYPEVLNDKEKELLLELKNQENFK